MSGPGQEVAEVRELEVPGPGGADPRPALPPAGGARRGRAAARGLPARRRLGDRHARRVRPALPRARQRVRRARREHRLPAGARAPVPRGARGRARRGALPGRTGAASSAPTRRGSAIAGDSAGGNLAAVTARRLRDEGDSPLRFQALIYPVCDSALNTPSYRDNDSGFGLSAASMKRYWELYLDGADGRQPDASPLQADDLAGLPPAFVLTVRDGRAARRGRGLRARAPGRRACP